MKNFTLIKRVIVLSLFSFLLVQCQKNETDKINLQEQEKDLSQIIATNENGVTLTEKDYQEFDKELNQRLEENRLMDEKYEREYQEYVKNGGRIDMENIPPPPSDKDYLPYMRPFDSFSLEEQKMMREDKSLTITDNPTVEVQKRMLFNQIVEKRKKKNLDRAYTVVASWRLEATYNNYSNLCLGGDRQSNNCAHYLSNSLMRSGFYELNLSNPYINARCSGNFGSYYSRRPIRAKEMAAWFSSMALSNSYSASSFQELYKKISNGSNRRFWVIFQGDGSYWGGHVAIINMRYGNFHGTGFYRNWPIQRAYAFN